MNHNFNHGSQVNFHPLYNQNYIPAYNGMINRNLIADESRMLMNINEKSGNLNQMGNHVNSKTIKSQKDSNYSRNDINQSNCDKY